MSMGPFHNPGERNHLQREKDAKYHVHNPCCGKLTFMTQDIKTCEVFACGHYSHQLQSIGHLQINNCCQRSIQGSLFPWTPNDAGYQMKKKLIIVY